MKLEEIKAHLAAVAAERDSLAGHGIKLTDITELNKLLSAVNVGLDLQANGE